MKVAFLGLGAMGLPMARRLGQDPDVELTLFDLDPGRLAQARDAGRLAASPREAIGDAEVIMSVLPADEHVLAVVEEIEQAGSRGQVYLDFSTIAPQTITVARERLEAVGIHTVGLGLLRGSPAAEAGTLVLYGGGFEGVRDKISPLLAAMSSEVVDLGTPEAAKALKVANNMVVGCLDAMICEVVALGEKAGASAQSVVDRLIEAGCDSWVLRHHTIPYVLRDDLGPGRFATRLMAKDMRLFCRMAEDYGCPSRLSATVLSYYRGALAHGHALDYHLVVVRWLRLGMAAQDVIPDQDAIAAVIAGAASIQALVTYDALAVTTAAGVKPAIAAKWIEEGSGGNDSLRAMIAGGDFSRGSFDIERAREALQRATDGADRLCAPASLFEIARLETVDSDIPIPV